MKTKVVVYFDGLPLVIIEVGLRVFQKEKLLDWYSLVYDIERSKLDCSIPLDEVRYDEKYNR